LYTTKIQDGGQQKPEVEITFERTSDGAAIPMVIPTLSAMPDSDMLLSTLPDVARHCLDVDDYRSG